MNAKTKGGYREGAGRKTIYDEPTKTIRVPVSRIVEIKNFLAGNKKPTFNDVVNRTGFVGDFFI